MLANQPYYQQQLPEIQAKPNESIKNRIIDLDKYFNNSDINNLNDMNLELHSKLVKKYIR